jgi:hypothetical protein
MAVRGVKRKAEERMPPDHSPTPPSLNSSGLLAQRNKRHIQPPSGPEKAFGQALREIRTSRKLSQEQLALEGDFDRTHVSLLERGLQCHTVRTIVKLAATLDVRSPLMIRRMERILDFPIGLKANVKPKR